MRKKSEIIIFGAGKGGERACKFLKRRYRVVGFCDNSPKRHGQPFMNRPILNPAQLKEHPSATIFIASQYSMEIYLQLTNELGIPKQRIEIVPDIVLVGEHDFPWLGVTALAIVALFLTALFIKVFF